MYNTVKQQQIQTQNQLGESQKLLQAEQLKNTNLQAQLDRMKSLVENLDSTKEELLQRLQATMNEKRGTDGDRAILANDIQMYQRSLMTKDQTINDLKMSIAQLDSNLDEMQSELDQKTEELVATKHQLEKNILEFSNVQHQFSITAGKEDNLHRKLFEREQEIKHLRSEITSVREQLD